MKTKTSTPKIVFLLSLLVGSPLAAQTVQSVGLLPPTVTGGGTSSGQVGLTGQAPAGGITVTLSSSDPATASVPASVVVPLGATTKVFSITTAAVQSTVQVTITARTGTAVRTAVLTVEPDYPPFFDSPPTTLLIGAFTLTVKSYESKSWDFAHNQMIDATGTATAAMTADGVNHAVPIRFENLVVTPVVQGTGQVVGGTAFFPDPAIPSGPESLVVAGFTLRLEGLTLSGSSAIATGKLWTRSTIADGSGQALPGQFDLGSFAITPQTEFYVSRPAQAFGDLLIGNTGIRAKGTGFTADFSTTQSPAANPPLAPSFRGLLLAGGQTVPAQNVISNTGYLKAWYGFTKALVTGAGFSGRLDLQDSFSFESLDPAGFVISLVSGHLDLVDNAVSGGLFMPPPGLPTYITVSAKAARDTYGNPLNMEYASLTVQPDLDLYGEVFNTGSYCFWGDLVSPQAPLQAYGATIPSVAYFYLSATLRPAFRPLDQNGNFKSPVISSPATDLESQNMQGVTIALKNEPPFSREFHIWTPDTPNQSSIVGQDLIPGSWINIAGRGVHGDVRFRTVGYSGKNQVDLGPTGEPGYASGADPFDTTWFAGEGREIFAIQFVDSAVYRSDARGTVHLEGPVKGDFLFKELQFTSTAQCPGAKVDLTVPLTLDYWQLDLVKKPGAASVGPMSVKTGQIFLTAAGIQEPRHFEVPFWLTWGELLASGQFGRIVFDHDSSGQKFDGFPFVPEVIALSEYDDTDTKHQKAFLQAAGTAHFEFFGANYLDLRDFVSPILGQPFLSRKIELGFDGLNGAQPTSDHVGRDWSDDFGAVSFKIGYDEADQDGFVSVGSDRAQNNVTVKYLSGPILGSLNLTRERTCISLGDMELHGSSLPPLGDFASMERITGCACIEDGQLKRMNIAGELDDQGGVVVLHAGTYVGAEFNITPATTELRFHGDLFVSVASGGADIQVDGQARFLVNRDESFVEGDLIGKIDASGFIGVVHFGGLSAEGQLSWHLGAEGFGDSYHSIQGRVAVGVVAPLGSSGVAVEGGFYIGHNAPREKAWVITGTDPRFQFDLKLPDRLTGVFGYAMATAAVSCYIVDGGFQTYAGLGAFAADDLGFPAVVGHLRAYIWGEVLGGLVSAAAWGDLQLLMSPTDPQFKGTIGAEVCAAWVLCASAEFSMLVNSDGVHFE